MKRQDLTPGIFTITDVLTAAECTHLIAFADAQGFDVATINAWDGPRLDLETRNNGRVIADDFDLAKRLWKRVAELVPSMRLGRQARGLNERFRFYRYAPGQRFAWHADAPFARENGELSLFTFMVYLNGGYQGGATRFESLAVQGQPGTALVFEHGLIHEGGEVTEGVKYVLRSDVMYGRMGQLAG
jgi:prolyl 4-hydroxylase